MGRKELEKLLKGNKNFVNGTPVAQNKTVESLRELAHHQEPKAVILSCSDSRVVPEIIFDCGIGELFVVRTAGAALGPTVLESVEFAIMKMKVPLLLILGHDDCGVMNYALKNHEDTTFTNIISQIYSINNFKDNKANTLAQMNTKRVKEVILKRSQIIKEKLESGELEVASAHFNFETGEVIIL